jgi:hypothetical protein
MNKKLFSDLMRFASSKKNGGEKIKYVFLGIIYYFFLAKNSSGSAKGNSSASGNESGDDIYPLF